MIRDALLAVGVLFSVFTSLRLPSLPIGIGEMCLAVWLAFAVLHAVTRLNSAVTKSFRRLLRFWILIGVSLCLGTMAAVVIGEINARALFIHDIVAYVLVAAISLLAVFDHDSVHRLRRVAWLLVLFANCALLIQLAQAFGVFPTLGAQVWFYNRFIGWTTNANQLGMLCLILFLLSLHLAQAASTRGARLLALSCSVTPFAAGLMTRSDSFVLALAVGLTCCVGLAYARILFDGSRRSALAIMTAHAPPLLLLVAMPLGFSLTAHLLEGGPIPAGEDSLHRDIGYRTELWIQAFDRIFASGLLGLGPGPHLVRSANLREPLWDALPDFEAHNTIIDLGLQGGVLAVAALVWLGLRVLRDTFAGGLVFLFVLTTGLCIFAQTHFIARHPLFWFAIAFALAASEQTTISRAAGRQGRSSIAQ